MGGGKCDIIGPVDVAQLIGYGRIAVFHGPRLRWEEVGRKGWLDVKLGARTKRRFCILYKQTGTNGSIVGDWHAPML